MIGKPQVIEIQISLANQPFQTVRLIEHEYGGYSNVFEGGCRVKGTRVKVNLAQGRQGNPGRVLVDLEAKGVPEVSVTKPLPTAGEEDWDELEFDLPLPKFRQFGVEAPISRPSLSVKIRRISGSDQQQAKAAQTATA